jgi:hypothetical protein
VILAEVTDEYLLKTISPAVILQAKPILSLIVITSGFFGAVLGVAVLSLLTLKRELRV